MRIRLILVGIAVLACALVPLPAAALAGTYVEPFTLITGTGDQGEPAVTGSVVVWVDEARGSSVVQQRYLPPADPPWRSPRTPPGAA
jgi:hypothetical protein